jgi:hypothetical protein
MFTREESSRMRQEFWTTFGRYMGPILSAEGMKVNWVNYHTGVKDVYFRMDATGKTAMISISLEHRDNDIRDLYFDQLLEFKTILRASLDEEWCWQRNASIDGRTISRVYAELQGVSILNKADWPDLISFFKPRIIALDSFWENARHSFEALK